jgi:tetratricopeptide (TPR) repeat protein
LRALGRHKESLSRAQEAVDLQCRLIATDPDLSSFLVRSPKNVIMGRFAHALENLAFSLSAVGNAEDAVRAASESVDVYRTLPDRTAGLEAGLANSLCSLAAFLRAVNRHEDASRADKEGADIYHNLAKTDAELTARSFRASARDLRSVGLHEDALRAEGQSAHLYRTVTQTRPALLTLRIKSLQSLAEDLRVLGRAEDAVRTDAELADVEAMHSLEQIPKN